MAQRGNPQVSDRAEIRRRFWATFLGSKVQSDGQVPGLRRWHDGATRFAQDLASLYANSCALKVERDGRDPDECIQAGVTALRAELRRYVPPEENERIDDVEQLAATVANDLFIRPGGDL